MSKSKLENEELPSNSKSSRVAPIRPQKLGTVEMEPTEKRVKSARRGIGIIKKKTITQAIAKSFVGEEARGVGQYILYDVLIPAAKNLLNDMVTSGIEMLLYGETKGGSRSRDRDKGRSIVSYGSFYKGRDRDDDRHESRRRHSPRDKFDLSDIYFRHHDEAEEVLDGLCELLEEYDQVTVSDYFDLAGIDGATWAHTKYGWEDLSRARNTHTREGWAIILPDPIPLD